MRDIGEHDGHLSRNIAAPMVGRVYKFPQMMRYLTEIETGGDTICWG